MHSTSDWNRQYIRSRKIRHANSTAITVSSLETLCAHERNLSARTRKPGRCSKSNGLRRSDHERLAAHPWLALCRGYVVRNRALKPPTRGKINSNQAIHVPKSCRSTAFISPAHEADDRATFALNPGPSIFEPYNYIEEFCALLTFMSENHVSKADGANQQGRQGYLSELKRVSPALGINTLRHSSRSSLLKALRGDQYQKH
jgi:hypothetical protein